MLVTLGAKELRVMAKVDTKALAAEIMEKYLHGGHGRRPEWLQLCIESVLEEKVNAPKKGTKE